MNIIIGKDKNGKAIAFGTHANAVQVGTGSNKRTLTEVLGEVVTEGKGHYEFRYQNSATQPAKPADGSEGLTGGWQRSATSPQGNEVMWMTQCFTSSVGVYDVWTTPARISG